MSWQCFWRQFPVIIPICKLRTFVIVELAHVFCSDLNNKDYFPSTFYWFPIESAHYCQTINTFAERLGGIYSSWLACKVSQFSFENRFLVFSFSQFSFEDRFLVCKSLAALFNLNNFSIQSLRCAIHKNLLFEYVVVSTMYSFGINSQWR